ncbi:MAG: hypothetical protein GY939_28405 [Actinomycetia bacterium]|nr:hypothetical protein [Actinomycetes bacterium]
MPDEQPSVLPSPTSSVVSQTVPDEQTNAPSSAVVVPANETTALLAGNTATGEWLGIPYRQYFAPDGLTVFAQLEQLVTSMCCADPNRKLPL